MSEHFLRNLDDIKEEQEAILERDMDPDMALLSDYVIGELTDEQDAAVRARIQNDPDFRDMAMPLLLAAEHGARPSPMPRADLDRKWVELRRRIGLPELGGAAPRADSALSMYSKLISADKRATTRRRVIAFAALLVLLVAPPAVIMYRSTIGNYHGTDWGRTELVSMQDGSRATLSMGTELVRIGDAATTREFVLKGEAAFDVTHGTVPFVVYTQSATITVTGTKFTVHAYLKEPTTVSVQEGTVRVQPRNARGDEFGLQLSVAAGQRARIVQGYPAEIVP